MTVTLYKIGKDGRKYYYSLHNRQKHLFSAYSYTVVWGRELQSGRERVYEFETRREMNARIRRTIARKVREGYKVLYSFARRSEENRILSELKEISAG